MSEVERVAKGLTDAQRQGVLNNRPDGGPKYGWRRSGSASRALERKGLLRERQDTIGNIMWSLTPLGLAVRTYLLEKQQ